MNQYLPTIIIGALLILFVLLTLFIFLWHYHRTRLLQERLRYRQDVEMCRKPERKLTLQDGKAIPIGEAGDTALTREIGMPFLESPVWGSDQFDRELEFAKYTSGDQSALPPSRKRSMRESSLISPTGGIPDRLTAWLYERSPTEASAGSSPTSPASFITAPLTAKGRSKSHSSTRHPGITKDDRDLGRRASTASTPTSPSHRRAYETVKSPKFDMRISAIQNSAARNSAARIIAHEVATKGSTTRDAPPDMSAAFPLPLSTKHGAFASPEMQQTRLNSFINTQSMARQPQSADRSDFRRPSAPHVAMCSILPPQVSWELREAEQANGRWSLPTTRNGYRSKFRVERPSLDASASQTENEKRSIVQIPPALLSPRERPNASTTEARSHGAALSLIDKRSPTSILVNKSHRPIQPSIPKLVVTKPSVAFLPPAAPFMKPTHGRKRSLRDDRLARRHSQLALTETPPIEKSDMLDIPDSRSGKYHERAPSLEITIPHIERDSMYMFTPTPKKKDRHDQAQEVGGVADPSSPIQRNRDHSDKNEISSSGRVQSMISNHSDQTIASSEIPTDWSIGRAEILNIISDDSHIQPETNARHSDMPSTSADSKRLSKFNQNAAQNPRQRYSDGNLPHNSDQGKVRGHRFPRSSLDKALPTLPPGPLSWHPPEQIS